MRKRLWCGIAVDNQGDVGIGAQTPTKKLDITGDTRIQGTLFGTGNGGQLGAAATIAGFDNVYGTRAFAFGFNSVGATPQEQIQIYAMSPTKSWPVGLQDLRHRRSDRSQPLSGACDAGGAGGGRVLSRQRQAQPRRAVIRLPHYFEALTRKTGRTIQLTNVGGFDRLAVKLEKGAQIRDGRFTVMAENPQSAQAFDWQVTAVRADGPPLETEPLKSDRVVAGIGPYTYSYRKEPMR